ncbi:type II toxin-antitoxin system death-on-curing family toxin [Vibrio sp. 10N.261.46.A3]|uniref:type II toxin-antitoxin system death-on-curing family toxin n=1 Tax=Vibrio sp. 10N.261.46.A3 TaxID=3229658 RepID=UPI00354D4478
MITTLSIEEVVDIHDTILNTAPGREGYYGDNKLGGAIGRIDNAVYYGGLDDVFDIAALYIEAIAMGHCFVDANKRTAFVSAITFLEFYDITIPDEENLAWMVEDFVKRDIAREEVSAILSSLAITNDD